MLIHFAFGCLGKKKKLEEQCESFLKYVLSQKRLKVSKCTEFIPVPNDNNSVMIDLRTAELEDNALILNSDNQTDSPAITYLPEDTSMICFIDISLNNLASSLHCEEYGKLGIIFNDRFYEENEVRKVLYYSEGMVLRDILVKEWVDGQGKLDPQKLKEIQKEITTYRKPKKLTENFSKSVVAQVKNDQLKCLTYNRYPEGYNFENENEWRMAFDEGKEYLDFSEHDVFQIIVPDEKIRGIIINYLEQNWTYKPKVIVFPSMD